MDVTKMKNIFSLSMLILVTGFSVAATAASTRAKSITTSHGITEIVEPSFSAPNGEVLLISGDSDLDGVCKLYGYSASFRLPVLFQKEIFDEVWLTYRFANQIRTVSIDKNGVFARLKGDDPVITTIYCTSIQSPFTGPIIEKPVDGQLNDDGVTVSITNPTFTFGNRSLLNLLVLENTNLDFVCKMAGEALGVKLTKAIPNSAVYIRNEDSNCMGVDVRNGKMRVNPTWACLDWTGSYGSAPGNIYLGRLKSLVCK